MSTISEDWIERIVKAGATQQQLYDKAFSGLQTRTGTLEERLLRLIMGEFVPRFAVDASGAIKHNAENLALAIDMETVFDKFNATYYQNYLGEFAADNLRFVDVSKSFYNQLGVSKAILNPAHESVTKLIASRMGIKIRKGLADSTIMHGSYLDNLLQASPVRSAVKNYVLQSVAGRTSYGDFLKGMQTLVAGDTDVDGRLVRYLKQYAFDTYSQTQRIVSNEFATQAGFKNWYYHGSVIEKTRPFCEEWAGKVITQTDVDKFDGMDWAGKIADVPFMVQCGGYNCRHFLDGIPDEAVKGEKQTTVEPTPAPTPAPAPEPTPAPGQQSLLAYVMPGGTGKFKSAQSVNDYANNAGLTQVSNGYALQPRMNKVHAEMYMHGIEKMAYASGGMKPQDVQPGRAKNVWARVFRGSNKMEVMHTNIAKYFDEAGNHTMTIERIRENAKTYEGVLDELNGKMRTFNKEFEALATNPKLQFDDALKTQLAELDKQGRLLQRQLDNAKYTWQYWDDLTKKGAFNAGYTVEDIAVHEMGHVLHNRHIHNGTLTGSDMRSWLTVAENKFKTTGVRPSRYAFTNEHEYFAEALVCYMRHEDDKVVQWALDWFNKYVIR